MTIISVLQKYNGVPRHEAELLLAYALKRDRLWVLTHKDFEISPVVLRSLHRSFQQLMSCMPLAQIIGLKRFYDHDFIVNKHVLIPRQETEELIDMVANRIKSSSKPLKIADIGTGSGCIGLTLAKKFPQHQFFLIDKSKRALQVARQNTDRLNLDVEILFGNLLLPVIKLLPDIVIANLPYLSAEVYQTAPASVRDFEPKQALYGGPDGLDVYRSLFRQVKRYYKDKSYPDIWLEISPEQAQILKDEIKDLHSPFSIPHSTYSFLTDLSRRFRFVHITFSASLDNKG